MTTSAARRSNSDTRRISCVATTAYESCSYSARSLIRERMIGSSFSVAWCSLNSMRAVSAPDVDFDYLERNGPHVANLVERAGVEPRPAALFVQLPRHRPGRESFAFRDLHDHRFRGVRVRPCFFSWRQHDSI